ncbi:hypothetical protein KP509_26G064500 [Ceratopteris richardii]|uniref:Uncharacterized protein n=1 Tax=Ceratopteris richardii TaxID=49495 RepID=A0A8T2RNN5_CERRI|nr:hypothetical protein KP509_26G064500 [Ceratopteris richardii]
MPGLVHRNPQPPKQPSGLVADCRGGSNSSLQRDGIELQKLQRVRKNLYCSRCNGLLLEAFSQIVAYSKSHQGGCSCNGKHSGVCSKAHCDKRCSSIAFHPQDDVRDPSVHPWGGLTATRDSTLTLLDSFVDGQPLEVIQNVCDCARSKERERELLYPDACGGGGRGWISQGNNNSGRGYSLKETCALHTARLSCNALVDFWSALGEETRKSLLRMKEEDFIARLMYRFESKRFCRDCRRNVLKELKELKELKRSRKEPKCTRWFCNADTAFQYEVSNTSVHVNWKECFGGDFGSTYQHFEWGLGSAEGSCDILGFEDVGLSEGAMVDGLDLSQFSLFYITLRAWKRDGRCNEVSVKSYGLRGKQCVHRRLFVGDGHVMITKGDSIKRFFEHAEEAEEEEDDDGIDKSGSEPENEGFRVQKHAKSPELAREFLLDAASIIFKEQVEKAFREGTARQNAHTIFVCLALTLLEERILVAYKEINTLEKQKQLLEEEEHEKREEELRRERKRLKEKEKKLRRKEKQKGREREKEKSKCDLQPACSTVTDCDSGTTSLIDENEDDSMINEKGELLHLSSVEGDTGVTSLHAEDEDGVLDCKDESLQATSVESMDLPDCDHFKCETSNSFESCMSLDNLEDARTEDSNSNFVLDRSKPSRRRSRPRKGPFMEVISRRFIRRSSVTSIDSTDSSQGRTKVSCTSVSETSEEVTEQVFVSTQKLHRGFMKPERNMRHNSMDGWNNPRYQHKQNGLISQSSSKRTFYVKTKQNDTATWIGKECLSIRSSQRKNAVVVDSQNVSHIGSFVSGSSQCNWQIMKAVPNGRAKRGSLDQVSITDSEIISSNSSESEKASESDRKERISICSDESAEAGMRSNGCPQEDLVTSGHVPIAESMNNGKPLGRVVAVSKEESLDDETSSSSSPFSAASCVTDSSDGAGTTSSMRSESSNPTSGCISVEASVSEPFSSGQIVNQAYGDELMHNGTSNANLFEVNHSAYKREGSHSVNVVERFVCADYYPFSSASDFLPYAHEYSNGYEHVGQSHNPEITVLNSNSHICHSDSGMQHPLLPGPMMQVHVPHSFGFPWMPSQCVTQQVMPSGLISLPHHPGSLYMENFGSSTGGMSGALLPLPPSFHHMPPVMGFACIPAASMNQDYTQWSEHQLLYDEGQVVEGPSIQSGLPENKRYHQSGMDEHMPVVSGSPNTSSVASLSSSDPLEFSLFHFGSLPTDEQELSKLSQSQQCSKDPFKPLDMSCSRAVQQETAGVPKPNLPVEEYSLFAATPSSRFSFF